MSKKLEVNIPFDEALSQMPHYAKFMKDIISKKRKLDEGGVVSLSSNYSAIIQKNLPHKMQDPGSFTIPCTIGNYEFGKALYDFGASIKLMSLSMVRILSLGELTPTTMSLQMVDRSMAQPEGILADVLINVGKFIFPIDFVVIDIEEDKQIPLLLSKLFLATGATLIDVKKWELTLGVGTEEGHFNLNQCLKQYDIEQEKCMRLNNVTPGYKEQHDDYMNEHPFDDYIFTSFYNDEFKKKELMTETVLSLNEKSTYNLSSEEKVQEEEKSSEGLILKELPKHLKYAFLGEETSKFMIMAANLTVEKEQKVVEILRKHKETIAWSVEDLKGISPSICMHKILREENAKTSIEH